MPPKVASYGEGDFRVDVEESFGGDGRFQVLIVRGNTGTVIQPTIEHETDAAALAEHLYRVLAPEQASEKLAQEARWKEMDARREAKDEAERPAREAAAAVRAEKLAAAPIETVARCPLCEYIDEPGEFDERGYECSSDGSTGVGPDGRRCDRCHRFRARVSDRACPNCEEPLPDGPDTIQARQVDGGYEAAEA